jgi:hypothetical protein
LLKATCAIFAAAAVGFFARDGWSFISRRSEILRVTRPYRFAGQFLSEGEAVAWALEAMSLAGVRTYEYQLEPFDGEPGPDGLTEKLFHRRKKERKEKGEPSEGSILFRRLGTNDTIYFRIEKDGDRFELTLYRGK